MKLSQLFAILCIHTSIHTLALPVENNAEAQNNVSKDCKVIVDIYKHFNLPKPRFALDENNMENCCSYEVRRLQSTTGNISTEWICEPETSNRVTAIILNDKNISTDIPWDLLSQLDQLQFLYLYNNQITGGIEGNLKKYLPNLQHLRVNNNNLSGYLPTYLPDGMKDIDVTGNTGLNDSIPKEWSQVDNLKCYVPPSVCNANGVTNACSYKTEETELFTCSAGEEDRSEALSLIKKDEENKDNDNNNNTKNPEKDSVDEETNEGEGKSNAVLIVTGSIVGLLLLLLLIVLVISYFSRKKAIEKEKKIYQKEEMNDPTNRTEASIFYSRKLKTSHNYNSLAEDSQKISDSKVISSKVIDDEIANLDSVNSISIFARINDDEGVGDGDGEINNTSQYMSNLGNSSTANGKLNQISANEEINQEEISFIEKVDPNPSLQSPNITLSDIDVEEDINDPHLVLQSPKI